MTSFRVLPRFQLSVLHEPDFTVKRSRSILKGPTNAQLVCAQECIQAYNNQTHIGPNGERAGPNAHLKYFPTWNPDFYNNADNVTVNNCLAYCVEWKDTIENRDHKPQPGEKMGCEIEPGIVGECPHLQLRDFTDPTTIRARLNRDFPDQIIWPERDPKYVGRDPMIPPPGYYCGCLMLAPGPEYHDYHFARMDSNGFWSHKPGATAVTNRDAHGELITNPNKPGIFHYDSSLKGTSYNYNHSDFMWIMSTEPERRAIMEAERAELQDKRFLHDPNTEYKQSKANN